MARFDFCKKIIVPLTCDDFLIGQIKFNSIRCVTSVSLRLGDISPARQCKQTQYDVSRHSEMGKPDRLSKNPLSQRQIICLNISKCLFSVFLRPTLARDCKLQRKY